MDSSAGGQVGGWWMFAVPTLAKTGRSSLEVEEMFGYINLNGLLILLVLGVISAYGVLVCWWVPGGSSRGHLGGIRTILGPRGFPIIGWLLEMGGHAHRRLAEFALVQKATALMALSFGVTRVVIASQPETAREILTSSSFADRPLKRSAQQLLFGHAIGFAPFGDSWRGLRRIAANQLFAPKPIAVHEPARLAATKQMRNAISDGVRSTGRVEVHEHLQRAALNNIDIMGRVFGRRSDFTTASKEAEEHKSVVRKGFELLSTFNWADYLLALKCFDAQRIYQRCAALVLIVVAFVQKIIDEHRVKRVETAESYVTEFVDVLLGLTGDEDMIAVLWERIFRGTDTTAILTELIMSKMVLHPEIQLKVQQEFRTRRINEAEYISDTFGVPTFTTKKLCGKQMTVKRSGAVTENQLQRLDVEVRFTPSVMLRPDGNVEVIVIVDYLRFEVVKSERTNNYPDHFIQSLKIVVRPTGKWSESFSEGFGLFRWSPGNELNPLLVQQGRSRGITAGVNAGVSPSAALQFNGNNTRGKTFHAFGFKKSRRDGHAYVCTYELRTFADGSSAQNLHGKRFYTIPKIPEDVQGEVNYPNLGQDEAFAGTWMVSYATAMELWNDFNFTISLEANLAAVQKCEMFSPIHLFKPPDPELKVWKGDSSNLRLCYC